MDTVEDSTEPDDPPSKLRNPGAAALKLGHATIAAANLYVLLTVTTNKDAALAALMVARAVLTLTESALKIFQEHRR